VKIKKYKYKSLKSKNSSSFKRYTYSLKSFIICIISISYIYFFLNQKYGDSLLINRYNYKDYLYKRLNTENLKNYRANLINGKLYWNNEISLNINELNQNIKMIKQLNVSFEKKEDFIKRKNPKVSIVITLHNREKYIKLVYSSIYIQELKDIEIIFVDDASNDNTSLIINELMEKDKRIIYLKNEINKRAYYSRCRGILESKGEYIIVIDSDDILINNILIKAYETAKKFDLDIVQFYIISGTIESSKKYLAREMKYYYFIFSVNMGLSYIEKDIHYCIKSVLYFLLFLFMIQLKLCSIYQLIAFFVVLIELIVKDRGDSILNHGIMNLCALFLLLSLGEIFILILIFREKKKISSNLK